MLILILVFLSMVHEYAYFNEYICKSVYYDFSRTTLFTHVIAASYTVIGDATN